MLAIRIPFLAIQSEDDPVSGAFIWCHLLSPRHFPLTPKTRSRVMKLSLFKSSNGHHMEFWRPHQEVAILDGLNMEEADGL